MYSIQFHNVILYVCFNYPVNDIIIPINPKRSIMCSVSIPKYEEKCNNVGLLCTADIKLLLLINIRAGKIPLFPIRPKNNIKYQFNYIIIIDNIYIQKITL